MLGAKPRVPLHVLPTRVSQRGVDGAALPQHVPSPSSPSNASSLAGRIARRSILGLVLGLATAFSAADDSGPRLEVRVSPRVAVAPTVIVVHASLVNLTEEWACPEVVWTAWEASDPAAVVSASELSDCVEWRESDTFWTKRYRIDAEGEWRFGVELRKGSRTLASQVIGVIVK